MRFPTTRDLGGLIKEARNAAGITQTELGEKIGASRYWVADVERGKSGAEFGLVLKALRALDLVLTVSPKVASTQREQRPQQTTPESTRQLNQPTIDLAATLSRTTAPAAMGDKSEPFRIHSWKAVSRPTASQRSAAHESSTPRKRKRTQ